MHSRRPARKGSIKAKEVSMASDSKTSLRGRDARTGEFVPVPFARKHPDTTVVERVPKPGYGDTKK